MVQDEVRWLLETIKTNWPGTWPVDENGDPVQARIHRDDPEVLETGERTKERELTKWNAIGASLESRSPEPVGDEYNFRVETTVSIRFEGTTSQDGEWGHIDSADHFEQLVRYAQHAIAVERSYPTVEDVDDDPIGSVAYHTISPPENETDLSADDRDYFRRDWEHRFIGYANQP
ncbi:hypothetical protein [Natrialba aegyptia]|uniref:Uncharacterized protein n=1 Tax=Natrialba aegyptia DSM 13077 TaxID=1227491 RepID=M0B4C0_9EURY|nr:hypothetical protein [Natrialba aegyptia]ELZ05377.1 hypothetical protein C480_10435 [Natrialba aegyptia DSM 13077]